MKKRQIFLPIFILFLMAGIAYAQVTFTDVTAGTGLRSPTGFTFSTWGDYDNDGDADLLFLHTGGKELYRNEGDGTFLDVTEAVGVTGISKGASTGMFMDFDNDGDLDLSMGGAYGDPDDLLYENNGDGTFTDVSRGAGVAGTNTGSVSFADYDNDGDLDIFTAKYYGNRVALYRNDSATNHWLQLRLVGALSNRDAIGARVKVTAGGLSMLRP